MARSYIPPSTGVRIDEFNESVVTATINDIELWMKLVEQARQAHGAWFDTCLSLARSIGCPRFRLPYRPGASVLPGEVPWQLFLESCSVGEMRTHLSPALQEELASYGVPDD
jgi:hypothetical protein